MKLQTSIIQDVLEFTDKNGNVVKTIPFKINAVLVNDRVAEKRIELSKVDSSDMSAYRKTAGELLAVLFGDDPAKEIIDYYQGDTLTAIIDLSPVLIDEIYPTFDRLRRNMIEQRKKLKRG